MPPEGFSRGWFIHNGVLTRRVNGPTGYGVGEWWFSQRVTIERYNAAIANEPLHHIENPGKPIVVAAHGMGGSHGNFYLTIEEVVDKGGVWLSGVLGGHGLEPHPMHLDDMADQYANGLEQFHITGDVTLLGHSLGAIVQARVAEWRVTGHVIDEPTWHIKKVMIVDSPVGEDYANFGYRKLIRGLGLIGADVAVSMIATGVKAAAKGHFGGWLRSATGMFFPPPRLMLSPPLTMMMLHSGVKAVAHVPKLLAEEHGIEVVYANGALDYALDNKARHRTHQPGTLIWYISVPRVGHAMPLTESGAKVLAAEIGRPPRPPGELQARNTVAESRRHLYLRVR